MARRPSYVAVPGSDRLRTRKRGASAAAPVEAAAPASLKRVEVEVDGGRVVVGPALLQGPQVPLLLEVMDRLGPLLSPESFVVYLQLYRLAVAQGKNACRLGLAELARRTGLQGRRLNKAIADAVAAGALVLVDRTRDGTLYRVRLPGEVLDEAPTMLPTPAMTLPTTTTLPGPAATTTLPPTPTLPATAPQKATTATTATTAPQRATTAKKATAAPAPATTATATTATTTTTAPRSVGDVCRWFEATWGSGPGRAGADVAAAVMGLLEDGETFATIPALLTAFVQRAPRTAPVRDLARYRD
jgi:hypothetical protein